MNGKLWSLRLGPVEVVNLLAVFFSGKSGHVCEVVSRSGDGVDGLHRGPRVGLHRRDPESGGHQRSLQRFPGNTFYSLPKEKLQILLQMSPSSFCFNFILYSLFTIILEQHSNLFPFFFRFISPTPKGWSSGPIGGSPSWRTPVRRRTVTCRARRRRRPTRLSRAWSQPWAPKEPPIQSKCSSRVRRIFFPNFDS